MGAGVASAIGMLASSISFEIARAAPTTLDALDLAATQRMLDEMDAEATALVTDAGVGADQVTHRLSAMMRYVGQGYEIETTVPADLLAHEDREGLRTAFTAAYRRRYGRSETMPEEILSWRLAVEGPRSPLADTMLQRGSGGSTSAAPVGHRPVWFDDRFTETPVYRRADIGPGTRIVGPAIVEEVESTTVLPPDFVLGVDGALNLIVERQTS